MLGLRSPRFRTLIPALMTAAILAAPAMADMVGGGLTITATNTLGETATVTIEAPTSARHWIWSSNETVEMRAQSGNVVATINPNGEETSVEYFDDPVINLAFTVFAGAAPTTFTITSAQLSFPAMVAQGRATAAITLTESDGDTARIDPVSGGIYMAQYNGFIPGGTTFADILTGTEASAWSSSTQSDQVPAGPGFQAIPGTVTDIQVRFRFVLTAHDQASGTSSYVITERPLPVENTTWGRVKSLLD